MSSAPEGTSERPGSLVLVWNGSDYELHRGAVILEDLYLERHPSSPPPHLLSFAVLRMDIRTTGTWPVLGSVGRGHIPHPAAVSPVNAHAPSC